MVRANARFAVSLFGKLRAEQPDANLFVSPFSVSLALAMTANGAAGETRTAMEKALEVSGLSPQQINEGQRDLKAAFMEADPKVELAIADSLWARQGIPFKPAFLEVNQEYYGAAVQTLDFGNPASARTINDWVSSQTKGLIPDIIDAQTLSARITMVILDAVYFKGKWTDPFDKSDTQDHPFALLKGEKCVRLMSQSGEYNYLETTAFQAIRLPYGNGRLEMLVFLPEKESSLAAFCNDLTADKWNEWLGQMTEREGTIKLPRFTARYDKMLTDALTALGMGVAFDHEKADLSALSDIHMWIDYVRHRSYVKVDEEGTEAAAVTIAPPAAGPPPPPPAGGPFEMIVDRPFLVAIRDSGTSAILFMGAIVDPQTD
jgi:serpin B